MICAVCSQPLPSDGTICAACGSPFDREAQPPRSGQTVPSGRHTALDGKWRLEKMLGEGGMAAVYLAHDLQLDRKVAVKILSTKLAHEAELVVRFEREARLTASLEHPHVVPVYAVGRTPDGRPYLVMKLLEGQTLAALLEKKGFLSPEEMLPLLSQLCAGLDFIHARGFIHRDIKPANVFVSPGGHVTVLDFGILRPREANDLSTRTGMWIGTPQYMSPEQALGLKEIDPRSDIYAVGVLLYECLAGTRPFEGQTELEVIQKQAHQAPPPISDRAPWLPPRACEAVMRALAKKREERYATAGELFAAFDAAFGTWELGELGGAPKGPSTQPLGGPLPPMAQPVPAPPSMPAPGLEDTILARRAPSRGGRGNAAPGTDQELEAYEKQLRRPRAARLAAGVALAVVVAGAGLWFARPHVAPPDATVAAAEPAAPDAGPSAAATPVAAEAVAAAPLTLSAPPDAGNALVVTPTSIATRQEPRAEAEPAPAPAEAAEADDDRPASHPPSAAAATRDALKRAHAKKGLGWVNVVTTQGGSSYWAQVRVDGEDKGRSPVKVALAPGKHDLQVERTGYRTVRKKILVAPGASTVVRIELRQ